MSIYLFLIGAHYVNDGILEDSNPTAEPEPDEGMCADYSIKTLSRRSPKDSLLSYEYRCRCVCLMFVTWA